MIDLHCHSTFSDGSLTPEALVTQAVAIGLTALALTDHDTMGGLERFLAAPEAAEGHIQLVPGVEISADVPSGEKGDMMHMLGYWMDPAYPELVRKLNWIRDGRMMRNHAILEKLNALGFSMTWDEVAARAGEDVVGRPHFAQVMIDKAYVKDKTEAFDKWLGNGKPGYADRERLSAVDAIQLIRNAGGVAVLAHPFTLHLEPKPFRALMEELAAAGLAGMECYYSEHSADLTTNYLAIAGELNLVPTGGSDFHGEASPGIRLGTGFGGLNVPDEVLPALMARRL